MQPQSSYQQQQQQLPQQLHLQQMPTSLNAAMEGDDIGASVYNNRYMADSGGMVQNLQHSTEECLNVEVSGVSRGVEQSQLQGGRRGVEAFGTSSFEQHSGEAIVSTTRGAANPDLEGAQSDASCPPPLRTGFREGRRGRALTLPLRVNTEEGSPKGLMLPQLSGASYTEASPVGRMSPKMRGLKTGEVWSPHARDSAAEHAWPSTPEARFVPQMQVHVPLQTTSVPPSVQEGSLSPPSPIELPHDPQSQHQTTAAAPLPTLLAGMSGHHQVQPCMYVMTPVSWVAVSPHTLPSSGPTSPLLPQGAVYGGGNTPPSSRTLGGTLGYQQSSTPPPVPSGFEPPSPQQFPGGCASEGLSSQSSREAVPSRAVVAKQMAKTTAIAQLQELLQSAQRSVHFRYPPGAKVLQWSHSEQRTAEGFASFRAVLAFFQDGVGHHITGGWERSKKHARQSAAECALAVMRRKQVSPDISGQAFVDLATPLAVTGTRAMGPAAEADVQLLNKTVDERTDMRLTGGQHVKPVLQAEATDRGEWCALVDIPYLGIMHSFSGPPRATKEAACAEAARRVLWYLQMNSFDGLYVPDATAIVASDCIVPDPPLSWAKAAKVDVRFRQNG
mmetsp:Transcript_13397/g.31451  ORF Transcript_13397/g.31451 Transcript_13397/m.31451 type:complete len:614 (+) Transcript_13397:116-1957(+)